MTTRPNVLFILADQHNAKVLGHAGHPDVRTPHLDRLAAEGVRMTNAITQNPICTPSRMCFLSGQYAHNHGYYGLSGPNPTGLPNLLGYFRAAGYTTSAIGKIHCPEYWVEDQCDVFHETCGSFYAPCDCSIGGRSAAYTRFLDERGKAQLEDHISLTEFGARGVQSLDSRPSPLLFEEAQEGWIAEQTIGFMRQAAEQGRPFFAHASLPRPHQCTTPSQQFWDLYDEAALTLPPNADADLAGKSPAMIATAGHWRTDNWALFEPKTFHAARLRKLHGYLGAVSQVDHAVGLLLDYLRASGLAENTIVIYSSDHGDYACEHGIMEKAPGIGSDAITRIPMLWWAPGRFAAGHTASEIVESVDCSTTLCALAGLDPLETSDGKDISHLLHGQSGDVHQIGVTEFAWSKSVRKGNYRLVFYPKAMYPREYPNGFGELYDLAADPWEMTNRYFDPAYAGVVAELQHDLLDWQITTTRPVSVLGCNSCATFPSTQSITRYRCQLNHDGKIPLARLGEMGWKNYL